MFSPESEIFLWIKTKKKKRTFLWKVWINADVLKYAKRQEIFFVMSQFVCLTTRCCTTSHLHQVFFRFCLDSLAFFARISYFKSLEFKEFNKTIIPFALVGYETGYSCLPSHIQRAYGIIVNYPFLRNFWSTDPKTGAYSTRRFLEYPWFPNL